MEPTVDIWRRQDETSLWLKNAMTFFQQKNGIRDVLNHMTHHDRIEVVSDVALASQGPEADIQSTPARKFDGGGIKINPLGFPSLVLGSSNEISVPTSHIQQ